jgi:hypothetical protein
VKRAGAGASAHQESAVLHLAWGEREHSAAPRPIASRTRCQQVSFGGVAFELLADRTGEMASLPEECRAHAIPGFDRRTVASVVCALHRDPTLPSGPAAAVLEGNTVRLRAAEEAPEALRVEAPGLRAELQDLGARRYAVTAHIAPDDAAMLALLRGISAAIVHREGGLVLHAAGAELGGRAVLFVGPSGAGKSTALRQTEGARCFAYDHVALLPGPEGGSWLAWGLPGGTAPRAPAASGVVFPLAAVLRVRQARAGEPRFTPASGTEALFAVRESVECADDSVGGEDVYLRAVTELACQVTIGSLATVLGRPNDAALAELLAGRAGRGLRS